MSGESRVDSDTAQPRVLRARWLKFSIRGMLIATLVFAAFFAGWLGDRLLTRSYGVAGKYMVEFPSGSRPASIVHLAENDYQIRGCGVLNGIYRFKRNQLLVIRPSDERMLGLIWTRSGAAGAWTLIHEPAGRPTGSSYVGVKLIPIEQQP